LWPIDPLCLVLVTPTPFTAATRRQCALLRRWSDKPAQLNKLRQFRVEPAASASWSPALKSLTLAFRGAILAEREFCVSA
jgi:hypothetical protein